MDRYHLLLTDIELFAAWAQGEGYTREDTPPHATYEALRLRKGKGPGVRPLVFFWRKEKQYVTVQNHAIVLVDKFLRDKERAPEKLEYLKTQSNDSGG